MNISWGYYKFDKYFISTRALIQYLARAAGNNANFLLNVGPMPNGEIQPEFVERLREMGKWLEKYGEAIYATRGGPITPRPWGVTTRKGNKIYLHILDWPDETLALPRLPQKIKNALFLKDGSPAETFEHESGLLLRIPPQMVDEYDTIVELELVE